MANETEPSHCVQNFLPLLRVSIKGLFKVHQRRKIDGRESLDAAALQVMPRHDVPSSTTGLLLRRASNAGPQAESPMSDA